MIPYPFLNEFFRGILYAGYFSKKVPWAGTLALPLKYLY
jgi:hypothetical protein